MVQDCHLMCDSNGDTAASHQAIDIAFIISQNKAKPPFQDFVWLSLMALIKLFIILSHDIQPVYIYQWLSARLQ